MLIEQAKGEDCGEVKGKDRRNREVREVARRNSEKGEFGLILGSDEYAVGVAVDHKMPQIGSHHHHLPLQFSSQDKQITKMRKCCTLTM